MRLHAAIAFAFLTFLLACQGAATQDEALTSGASKAGDDSKASSSEQKTSGQVSHSSEAVIGPDDAFFAALYLQQIFRASKEQHAPSFNPNLTLTADRPGAFEFAANFSDARLQLMAKALLILGDKDKDELMSESEFLNLRLDLSVFGAGSEVMPHSYSKDLFQAAVGENSGLDTDGLKSLLRGLSPLVKAAIDQKTAQEQRLQVLKAWEKILSDHDSDRDGTLSWDEQKALRVERSEIMARLLQ